MTRRPGTKNSEQRIADQRALAIRVSVDLPSTSHPYHGPCAVHSFPTAYALRRLETSQTNEPRARGPLPPQQDQPAVLVSSGG